MDKLYQNLAKPAKAVHPTFAPFAKDAANAVGQS